MQTNTATRHVHASSLALALVLLVVLGLLAMRAEAQEPTEEVGVMPVRALMQENREERRALVEEVKEQREEFRDTRQNATATPTPRWETVEVRVDRVEMMRAIETQRTELRARVEARRAEWQERAEERKARLTEEAQERLGQHVVRMTERMNRILDQLASIADRIESHIAKMEEERGVDLNAASEALSEARTLITAARGDVEDLEEYAADALSSDDPKMYLEEVRELVEIVRESTREVHQALRDAVVEIKAGTPEDKPEAEEGEETEE